MTYKVVYHVVQGYDRLLDRTGAATLMLLLLVLDLAPLVIDRH